MRPLAATNLNLPGLNPGHHDACHSCQAAQIMIMIIQVHRPPVGPAASGPRGGRPADTMTRDSESVTRDSEGPATRHRRDTPPNDRSMLKKKN